MNNKLWIAQSLEPPSDYKKWNLKEGNSQPIVYYIVLLIVGWVLGILTMIFKG